MLSGNKQFHVCGAAERVAFAEFVVRKRVRFCEFVKSICSREGALWMNTIHLDRHTLRECLASDDEGSKDDYADDDKAHQRRQPQLQRGSEHTNDAAGTTTEAKGTHTRRHRRGGKGIYVRIPIDASGTGKSSSSSSSRHRHRSSSEANVDVASRCRSGSGDSSDSVDDDDDEGQRDGGVSCVYIACPALPCVASTDSNHNGSNSSSNNKQEKATRQQLSCFATLAASLSELLLSPMSAAAFAECVLGLLLEADVVYAHGTTARALAQRHLRTYRLRLQQQPPHRGLLADNDTTPGELRDALLSLPLTAKTTLTTTTATSSSALANTHDHVRSSSSGGGGSSYTNTTDSSLLPPATTAAEAGTRAANDVSSVGSDDRDNGCDNNATSHTAAAAAAAAADTFDAGAGDGGDVIAAVKASAAATAAVSAAAATPPPLAMRPSTTLPRTLQSVESRTRHFFLSTEHEAYVSATPHYDVMAASLCSMLVFTYRRLCDYELLTSRCAVDRLLRIDKRVRQLVLRPLCDTLTHVARQQMLNDVYVLSRGGLFADLSPATRMSGVGAVAATSSVAEARSGTAPPAATRRGDNNNKTTTTTTTADDGAVLCRAQNKANSHLSTNANDQPQQSSATAPTVLCDNNNNKNSGNRNSSSSTRQDEAGVTSAAFLQSIVQSQDAALREADAEDAQLCMASDDSDSGVDNND